jgi:outer membrane protein TolC
VADAAFFPSIVLSASAGTHGMGVGSLVSAPRLLGSLGPSLVAANLAALAQLDAELQLQLQQAALQAAQHNQHIVLDQYQAGTVSYLNVASAQAATLAAEASVLSLRNRQLVAANLLLKNIGGRWA